MTNEEMISQLVDLINDRKSLISNASDIDNIFSKDIEALEKIINIYRRLINTYETNEKFKNFNLDQMDCIPDFKEYYHNEFLKCLYLENSLKDILMK